MEKASRTYVGETGTQAFDGWAGFRIGQSYDLTITRHENGDVDITLDHEGRERDLTLTADQWERWFKK